MPQKIGIMTFHRAINYGALLQTYGLYTALKRLGKEPEIIDYHPHFMAREGKIDCAGNSLLQKGRNLLISLVLYRSRKLQMKKFRAFLREHLKLSAPVSDLRKVGDSYDAYITGSDQVFNREITQDDADAYLLTFVKEPEKKFSYAASFGAAELKEAERDWYRERLASFAGISVREQSGVEIVRELTGKTAETMIDPTLLIPKEEWASLSVRYPLDKLDQPYILVYKMLEKDRLYHHAQEFSRKTGLQVICIGGELRMRKKYPSFTFLSDASPEQFLSLFENAAYVMTSSFHGTAFSVLFERQFVSIFPLKNTRSDRARSLLSLLHIEDRLVDSYSEDIPMEGTIDWEGVQQRLEIERECARRYLSEIGTL